MTYGEAFFQPMVSLVKYLYENGFTIYVISGSDTSMMNYTIDSRNPYPALAYMVVADDSVREWGKQNWEEKSADWAAKGFIPVSMKNDFAQIYEEGIVPAAEQYNESDWIFSEAEALLPAA